MVSSLEESYCISKERKETVWRIFSQWFLYLRSDGLWWRKSHWKQSQGFFVLALYLEPRSHKANPPSPWRGFCGGVKLIVSCGVQTLGKLWPLSGLLLLNKSFAFPHSGSWKSGSGLLKITQREPQLGAFRKEILQPFKTKWKEGKKPSLKCFYLSVKWECPSAVWREPSGVRALFCSCWRFVCLQPSRILGPALSQLGSLGQYWVGRTECIPLGWRGGVGLMVEHVWAGGGTSVHC